MDHTTPPLFTVHRLDRAAARRRWLWLTLLLLAVAVLAGGAGFAVGHHRTDPMAATQTAAFPAPVASADRDLAQQVAILKRSAQASHIAAADLRQTLVDRDQQISGLRADVAFYSRLVGSGEKHSGVAVHGVQVQPIKHSHAFNATITLTQNAKRGRDNSGIVKLAIEGVKEGKLIVLDGTDLGGRNTDNGLTYAFKYFQQLHTTVILPPGFVPNRLRITVKPEHARAMQRTVTWTDALGASANKPA